MLSIASVVLSVVALTAAYPLNPPYPNYPAPQAPLYYYYYTPSAYPSSTYGQYPYGYTPSQYPTGYTPSQYPTGYTPGQYPTTGFTSGLTPSTTNPGLYTFGNVGSGSSDAPTTTTLPTLQVLTEFFQNIFNNLRPKPPTTTGETASEEATSSTTYFNPQTSTLYVRPGNTRYSYSYPAGQQQTYGGASYYPYTGYNSQFYFPRYQANQPLTTTTT